MVGKVEKGTKGRGDIEEPGKGARRDGMEVW